MGQQALASKAKVLACPGHSEEEIARYLQAVEDEIENEERQTLKDWYAERGMECIGVGDARFVFALCAEHVLKVNYNEEIDANAAEAMVWERASEEMRSYLAPVVDYSLDEHWLIMARCSEYTGPRPQWLTGQVKELFTDAQEGNLGVWQGKVVLLDYPAEKGDLARFLDGLSIN
jgi:hypothetical protein